MLVLFSDIHLTDGTSGETINQETFDLFADQVAELARKRDANEVRLVILGDGLDLIRSSLWNRGAGEVRPWSRAGREQERIVNEIVASILRRNREALDYLADTPRRVAGRSRLGRDNVTLEYVLGNHDWLVNRYRSTRKMVAGRLDLHSNYVRRGFPLVLHSPRGQYDLVARHGDVFDSLNYNTGRGRDASSIGDAIVVELLDRFPFEVTRELDGHPCSSDILLRLKEIDNVRPYGQIFSWVGETMRNLGRGDPRFTRAARVAMERCAKHFLGDPHLRALTRHLPWLQRQYLRLLLGRVRRRDIDVVDAWTQWAERVWKLWQLLRNRPVTEYADYPEYAAAELTPDGRTPRLVVYGHTHEVASIPLGPSENEADERFYINTGTWRTVWEKAQATGGHVHFSSWKVMSYVAVYNPHEGYGRHEFELWQGNLRDRVGLTQAPRSVTPRTPVPARSLLSQLETAQGGK